MTLKPVTLQKGSNAYIAARDFYYDNIYPNPKCTFHEWLLKYERVHADYELPTIVFDREEDKIMFLLKWSS